MEYHKTLIRQLKNLGLDGVSPSPQDWEKVKEIVSKTYTEADQERYLLERSMELSSQEMLEINQRLERAQEIAGLGYWTYDKSKNLITMSRELYRIYGLNPSEPAPSIEGFMERIHEENRKVIKKLMEKAFSQGLEYEYEFQMKHSDGKYRWYRVIGRPVSLQKPITTLTGIVMDITKRKAAEEQIADLHAQLVTSARLAGMADIASSTLHNVGNVLNSANVSVEFLKERNFQSDIREIENVRELLKTNLSRLPEYLQTDPRGKFVPEYLIELLKDVKHNYETFSTELESLSKSLSHIKDIILTQSDMSRASGINEKVFMPEILDTALDMTATNFDKYDIHLHKNYQESSFVFIDKVKVLQILVNLIRNAKEALMEASNNSDKKLEISLVEDSSKKNMIIIKIKDNGIGIPKENLNKIFSLGFTTKIEGHGLGLHMSAISARELGGTLSAESKGEESGATFTLTLPRVEAGLDL
ncbi:MAG: PAS domain S-box protein [Alphaproteobacteria bacterium]|nr:PAS domain S-box protein [Alphaproteobacteria bacterium]